MNKPGVMKVADLGTTLQLGLGEVWQCVCGHEDSLVAYVFENRCETFYHRCPCGVEVK